MKREVPFKADGQLVYPPKLWKKICEGKCVRCLKISDLDIHSICPRCAYDCGCYPKEPLP